MPATDILASLEAQVRATTEIETSAVTLINGFSARVQAAVDAAIAGGATAEQLAPVQTEVDALTASNSALAAAVAANTEKSAPFTTATEPAPEPTA